MAYDFPNTPTVGQIISGPGGIQWRWDGTKWVVLGASVPGPSPFNYVHNPYFNIAQRGGGPWTAPAYTADRWLAAWQSDTTTVSLAALSDADRTAIGDEYARVALQLAVAGSSAAGSYTEFVQRCEQSTRFSNKQVTVSFWARAPSGTPKLGISYRQSFGSGGSPSPDVVGNLGVTPALSTTWQRYSVTATLPSQAGKTYGTASVDYIEIGFWLSDQGTYASRSGGIGVQSGTVQFWGMQLEVGSTATALAKIDPETDWANCQRFYQPYGNILLSGYNAAGGDIFNWVPLLQEMRAGPTVAFGTISYTNANTLSVNYVDAMSIRLHAFVTATGTAIITAPMQLSADL